MRCDVHRKTSSVKTFPCEGAAGRVNSDSLPVGPALHHVCADEGLIAWKLNMK